MKISVNAGHTKYGLGGGAIYAGIKESDINRDVARALCTELRQKGHKVYDATVDSALSNMAYLQEVCKRSNNVEADLFISIHCNASTRHTGHGVEAFTWKGKQHPVAVRICQNIASVGFRNRGVKDGRGLYVIKHTKAPAILVELFFLDNEKDRNTYQKIGAKKIAKLIADSI